MKAKLIQKPLSVRLSAIAGYGVFAEQAFVKDEMIEECIILPTHNQDPAFVDYYFKAGKNSAIALGFGSIYNHASDPNAGYEFDFENKLLIFRALRPIAKDEEIFVSYGDRWFSERVMAIKKIPRWRKALHYVSGAPLRAFVVAGVIYLIIYFFKTDLSRLINWFS